jgi:aldehyde:ferredoxin oxidoreductase
MGAMTGCGDLDTIARLDYLCDDIGLDTISTGVAIAVAMDAGYKEFGGTLDRFSAEGQVEASRNFQTHMAAVDTVGICDFAQSGLAAEGGLQNVCKMISAKSGRPFEESDWRELGIRVLRAEREFNRKAGFTNEDDRLPEMFYKEPLPPHNKVVVISDAEMDTTFDF